MEGRKVLMLASVASMIDQFNMSNIRLISKMGYEVHVACNFKEGNTCDEARVRELLKILQQMQVVCHQWDCPRNIYCINKCIGAYRELVQLMDRYSFAWMHCQSPAGGALARLAGRRRRVRMIYTAHGFHFYQGAPWKNWLLYYPAEKLLAHWTDVIITVNQEDYGIAKRKLKAGRIYYIPGVGIDISRFRGMDLNVVDRSGRKTARQEFCRKYRIPEDARILLSVGELSKRKNHQAVMRAVANLQDKDVYYLVCGQGKLKNRLKVQAKELGISQRVRLTGYQENVEQLYQNADLFVFPSLQEGLPAALMEAMAAGLACVVSDIRGNRELIDAKGGIRFLPVPPGVCAKILAGRHYPSGRDTTADSHCPVWDTTLEEAVEMLLGNEKRRQACGRHNQQKIKQYDQKEVNRRMKMIYASFERECCRKDCTEKERPGSSGQGKRCIQSGY